VTPKISASGIRLVSGGSASKMNLLTPTGMGPTSSESSSWSCSSLELLARTPRLSEKTYEVADPT
jgi:hypothetical protein